MNANKPLLHSPQWVTSLKTARTLGASDCPGSPDVQPPHPGRWEDRNPTTCAEPSEPSNRALKPPRTLALRELRWYF